MLVLGCTLDKPSHCRALVTVKMLQERTGIARLARRLRGVRALARHGAADLWLIARILFDRRANPLAAIIEAVPSLVAGPLVIALQKMKQNWDPNTDILQPIGAGKRKRKRIGFRKKKRRGPVRPLPDVTVAPQQDQSAEHDPTQSAEVTAAAGQNDMSIATSYSTTLCCVDLGTMRTDPAPFRPVPQSSLGNWITKGKSHSAVFGSSRHKTAFFCLGNPVLNTGAPLSTPQRLESDADTYAGFNGTMLWQDMFDQHRGIGLTKVAIDNLKAQYAASGAGVADANQVTADFVCSSQQLEVKIKNVSSSGSSNANETPVYITLYWVKMRRDLHMDKENIAAGNNDVPLQNALEAGFRAKYDTFMTSNQVEASGLADSAQQDYHINIGDNAFVDEFLQVIDTKHFVLANGQTGTLRLRMGPQYISGVHMLRAVPHGGGDGDYNPVYAKKGEQFLMMKQHGCLEVGGADGTTPTSGTIEATTIGVHFMRRFKFAPVLKSDSGDQMLTSTQATFATSIDVDMDHTTTA